MISRTSWTDESKLSKEGRKRRRWGIAIGVATAGVLVCACGLLPKPGDDDAFSDAQWAFDKDQDELTSLENHCLKVAQAYCADLAPCCAEISVPIEREICISQAADKCFGMSYDSDDLSEEGRLICLERAATMFDGCGPQTPPIQMPIDIRHNLRCEDQWPSTVVIPEAVGLDEPCGDVDGLPETRDIPCEEGLYCHREYGSEASDPRVCRTLVTEGSPCNYGNECIDGTVCNNSICQAFLALGESCEYHDYCESGACCNGLCVEAPAVDAHLCWIYTYPGKVVPSDLQEGNICDSIEYNERGRAGEVVLL